MVSLEVRRPCRHAVYGRPSPGFPLANHVYRVVLAESVSFLRLAVLRVKGAHSVKLEYSKLAELYTGAR